MIVLVDMYGVIANFEGGVLEKIAKKYPKEKLIALENRTTFHIKDQYPQDMRADIESVYFSEGFFFGLKPINGSLEGISNLSRTNNVFICTSPISQYEYCIKEKYDWVNKWLGKEWVKKIISCNDKTLIRGDILIDDKPEVTGVMDSVWKHVLYSQPYNRDSRNTNRMVWNSGYMDILLNV